MDLLPSWGKPRNNESLFVGPHALRAEIPSRSSSRYSSPRFTGALGSVYLLDWPTTIIPKIALRKLKESSSKVGLTYLRDQTQNRREPSSDIFQSTAARIGFGWLGSFFLGGGLRPVAFWISNRISTPKSFVMHFVAISIERSAIWWPVQPHTT